MQRDQYFHQLRNNFSGNPQTPTMKPHLSKLIIEYINDQVTLGLMVPQVNSENELELDVPEKSLNKLHEELGERVVRYYNKLEKLESRSAADVEY